MFSIEPMSYEDQLWDTLGPIKEVVTLSLISSLSLPLPPLFFLSPFSTSLFLPQPCALACFVYVCCMYMFIWMQTSVHAEAM